MSNFRTEVNLSSNGARRRLPVRPMTTWLPTTVNVTGKVDLKSKVNGCISAKSLQVVLALGRRLRVALASSGIGRSHQSHSRVY